MKVGEAVKYLKGVLSQGPVSDDYRLSDRLLYHLLISLRAELIRQKVNKRHFISPINYQSLCLSMELVDKSEVPDCYTTGTKLLKSVDSIPSLLLSRRGLLIEQIRTLAGNHLDLTEPGKTRFNRYSKHKAHAPMAFIRNDHIYIINDVVSTGIVVDAVLFDPIDKYLLSNTCVEEENCLSALDIEFPIDQELMGRIYNLSQTELVRSLKSLAVDTDNNTKDDTDE